MESPKDILIRQMESQILSGNNSRNTVILAGERLIQGEANYSLNYGIYPEQAFEIALQVVSDLRDKIKQKIYLLILINDVDLLEEFVMTKYIINGYWASPYYELGSEINKSFRKFLYPVNQINSSPQRDRQHFRGRMSAQKLRHEYQAFLKKSSLETELPSHPEISPEFLMIIRNLYRHKIGRLISLLPKEHYQKLENTAELFNAAPELFIYPLNHQLLIDNYYLNSSFPKTVAELFSVDRPQIESHYQIG